MYGAVADGQFQIATDGVRLIRIPCAETRNVRFERGGGMVEGGLDLSYYPNVHAVFPREFNQIAWYDAQALRTAAKVAIGANDALIAELWAQEKAKPAAKRRTLAAVKGQNAPLITFTPEGPAKVTLTSVRAELDLQAQYDVEPLDGTRTGGRIPEPVTINARYLVDALVGAKGPVIIRLVDAYSPVQIEHGDETHLIMPIRA
jgi:DNA polymerase III sliding clamp (beta) subunit (PCNA family)